jgi:hypothetical protein
MTGASQTSVVAQSEAIVHHGPGGEDVAANQTYSGTAVGVGDFANLIDGDLGNASVPFKLEISGVTPPEETRVDAQILNTKGQEALRESLSSTRLGSLSLEGHPDVTVRFVQESRDEAGLSVTALCDRWLNKFVEGYEDMSPDYPFAFIEFSFDKRCQGQGHGVMFTAVKIKFDRNPENAVGVEDYANYPDRLIQVGAARPAAQ